MPLRIPLLAVSLALALSSVARADIVPPHPPERGIVTEDLPPPEAPPAPASVWALRVAGGVVVVGGIGLAGLVLAGFRSRSRRKEA